MNAAWSNHNPNFLNVRGPWSHSIRAVAFDMDGLMINTEDLYEEIGDVIMQRRGKRMTSETRQQMMGRPARQAWEYLIEVEQLSEDWQTLQAETVELFQEILPSRLQTLPGLLELIECLEQREIPRCVVTSSHRKFAEHALGLCNVLHRFHFILTAEDVTRGKPSPDVYLLAAERLGIQPAEMLVLEDSGNGSHAAASAGACTVAVPSRHTIEHRFPEGIYFAQSLADPIVYRLMDGKLQ